MSRFSQDIQTFFAGIIGLLVFTPMQAGIPETNASGILPVESVQYPVYAFTGSSPTASATPNASGRSEVVLGGLNVSNPSPIAEPYPVVSGSFTGKKQPHSPDPLVGYRWADPKASDGLEIYSLAPKSMRIMETEENYSIRIEPTRGKWHFTVSEPVDIQIDFGRVSPGWLEFDSEDLVGKVEMSISEYNEPAVFNAGSQHPKKTAKPVRHGNTWRLELNDDLYEGVRYGWIHIKSLEKEASITDVRLVCQTKPVNYRGIFSSSDTLLTRIWYTGAYTVRTNLLKDYFGAILMERSDRHAWTGDAHPSQAASMVAFGNYDFVKKNLEFTSRLSNGIPAYALYWTLSLVDYYMYTGDGETFAELKQNALHIADSAASIYDTDFQLSFYGWDERLGAGFENPDRPESHLAYKMLAIRTWKTLAQALEFYGDTDLAGKYSDLAEQKMAETLGSYAYMNMGVHAAAEMLNTGFELPTTIRRKLSDKFGRLERLSYSPFNQFFILQAMAATDMKSEALTTVDDCWGGQIRYGGTTFFEVFRPSWVTRESRYQNVAPPNNQCGYTSLTHPWSAGVTKWLSEEILGIKPTSPGFKTFEVKPYLGPELCMVSGTVPLVDGEITLFFEADPYSSATLDDDWYACKAVYQLTVPAGTTADIGIPKLGQGAPRIQPVKGSLPEIAGNDKNYVYYKGLPAGEYAFDLYYEEEFAVISIAESAYLPLDGEIKKEREAGGNWLGTYGSKGYVLCNAKPEKTNTTDLNDTDELNESLRSSLASLPDYVKDVRFSLQQPLVWESKTKDERALQTTESNNKRTATGWRTNDPWPTFQTMTVDIECDYGYNNTVSLYFVDWDRQGRRQAIEVFDLKTMELISPVYTIKDFEEGVYVRIPLEKSMRIRINQVRGENAVLSGVFFD